MARWVVRAEVGYGDPLRQEYQDLWVIRFAEDAGKWSTSGCSGLADSRLREAGCLGAADRASEEQMTVSTEQISRLLHEAGETHHRVFRIVDGADDDWASWYSDWLVNLSELPTLLGTKPVRSELTYLLVSLDKAYAASQADEPWESYYAQQIFDHFRSSGS
jgi:hypothetical protein